MMPKPERRRSRVMGWCTVLVAMAGTIAWAAADAKSLSARLSDEAFALLTSISAKHDSNPLLGPIGVFAADAQKLSSALQSGDRRVAGAAMAALKSDAAEVDKKAASGGLESAKWDPLKHDLESLSALVPAASEAPAPAAAASAESTPSAESAPSAAPSEGEASGGPTVRIESSQAAGPGVVRVKGYMSGRGLRSAGIYEGDSRLANLTVKRVPGEQTIRFDLQIGHPPADAMLRVYDSAGRSAQAPIVGEAEPEAAGPVVESGPPIAAPPPAPSLGSDENMASTGGDDFGPDLSPSAGSEPGEPESASSDNTKEIPAAQPSPSGPKRRMRSHLRARGPNDVHIRIDSLTVIDPGMHDYMVRGQISGSDLNRAGIYVDGRLAQDIPLDNSPGFHASDFAQSFTALGSETTIRVYRTQRDYSESSLNLTTATSNGAVASSGPVVINSAIGGYGGALNPGQLSVQITSVQAAAPSLYVVSGTISGHNIASAGIYQNGMLVQPLSLSGGGISGGIGGLISGLIPGATHQVSFVGRFNPALGFATVRAYDRNGMMAEQPIMAGGSPFGVNPYGAVNPYMSNPYGGISRGFGTGIGIAPGIGAAPGTGAGIGIGTAPW